ncbi:MAG: polynucleotide adenylyltransferase PcnB [Endozoicomonas sp. (ex Botrylloides leachii)]|nr:polynucleotide adenylyltransferase PcnB [Endozoicomonas sp. (ex Botrylloides leachii)]
MQEWLSTAVGVFVIVLIFGLILRQLCKRFRRDNIKMSSGQAAAKLPRNNYASMEANQVAEADFITRRDNHPISRKKISDNALKVLNRLTSQGHDAYLVGGCIRDMYLGLQPKDFDVATSATPEEVRQLFRNSRVIGRRFKLVHILFGRETIEVATFRANHSANDASVSDRSQHSASGRILRDNVYGSMEDDALRRDFTINALYYDSRNFTVIDYCGGINDLHAKQLRLIGDARLRYHEDPVRMLRAVRFAAKLSFNIATETKKPIQELASLLKDIPSSRLFDEVLKLLQSGNGVKTFSLLREYELLDNLFPATNRELHDQNEYVEALIHQGLLSTDDRIRKNKPVTPAFLFATLLWGPLNKCKTTFEDQGIRPVPALQQAAMAVLENQARHTAIPKRFSMGIREIWELQHRLERRQPRTINSILEHPRFRAAYDFLLLREAAGEQLADASKWWTDIQKSNEPDRQKLISTMRGANNRKTSNSRKYRRRKQIADYPRNRK